ncbi:MAG: hypothetical protein EZS28_045883, partial [Streblomastix strix]
RPVFIPPHSSHAFQVEDLLTFALLKQELRKANAYSEARTQAQTIARLVAATEAATTPSRNRSAFRRAAITSELVDGRYVARIDEAEYNARMAELFPGEFGEQDKTSAISRQYGCPALKRCPVLKRISVYTFENKSRKSKKPVQQYGPEMRARNLPMEIQFPQNSHSLDAVNKAMENNNW